MARGRKAIHADTNNDIAYYKARLEFTETVLAALAELHIALQKAVAEFDRAYSRQRRTT